MKYGSTANRYVFLWRGSFEPALGYADTSTYLSSQIHLDKPVNILYVSGIIGCIEIDERSSYSHNRLGNIAKRIFCSHSCIGSYDVNSYGTQGYFLSLNFHLNIIVTSELFVETCQINWL